MSLSAHYSDDHHMSQPLLDTAPGVYRFDPANLPAMSSACQWPAGTWPHDCHRSADRCDCDCHLPVVTVLPIPCRRVTDDEEATRASA